MDVARYLDDNRLFSAQEFGRLPASVIARYRRRLACDGCDAPAYFTAKRSNGNSFFFGARPHVTGCEFATQQTGDRESADLFAAARREALDGILRIVPDRVTHESADRFEHDPDAESHTGKARRFARLEGGERTIGSIQMNRLLRRLLRDEAFAASDERLKLEDAETTVRDYCVELNQIRDASVKRKRLYWGTVIFCEPTTDGGAWLHTAKGLPSVRLSREVIDLTLTRTRSKSVDELSGSSFLVWAWLSPPLGNPDARPFLMARDPNYFTLRLASQDQDH
ncbi:MULTISPECIES: hypothetical protein [unclassified Leucobacter]|uniref:hypothetical protein n=1 Tax=unclassified Leucobacter TaxID=2621730 RepID=UPI00301B0C9F